LRQKRDSTQNAAAWSWRARGRLRRSRHLGRARRESGRALGYEPRRRHVQPRDDV